MRKVKQQNLENYWEYSMIITMFKKYDLIDESNKIIKEKNIVTTI